MKKIYAFVLVLILVLSTCCSAFASVEDVSDASTGPLRIGERERLSVPLYKQSADNYCGPACLQMTIKYIKNQKIEQSVLAKNITEASGTIPANIASRINEYVGAGTYRYIGLWETSTKGSFFDNLKSSIIANKPVFCQVKTAKLPNYAGKADYGHWVLATGYAIQTGATTQIVVYYNDPINKEFYGSFSTYLETMVDAIKDHSSWYVSD